MATKVFDGYIIKPNHGKVAISIDGVKSKKAAYSAAKEFNPGCSVHITGYHLTNIKKKRITR